MGLALRSKASERELRLVFEGGPRKGARARKFPDISFVEIEGLKS